MEEQKKKKKKKKEKKLFGIHYCFFRRVRLTLNELQNSQSLNFTKTSNFLHVYRIDKSLNFGMYRIGIHFSHAVFLDMN